MVLFEVFTPWCYCGSVYTVVLLLVLGKASWLHKAIPIIGANACAALKHTLLVVGLYFIRSFLAMGCPTNFAARILKILACSYNLACTIEGCFYMVLKGPFLNGTRLPVDQILLLGCVICQSP